MGTPMSSSTSRRRPSSEKTSGRQPTRSNGQRAPVPPRIERRLSITRDSLWALEILVEEGFTHDSSIFPVRNDRYGIPDAPLEPHVRRTPAGDLVEVPMRPLELFGRRIPFSGGAYLRILPWWSQSIFWWLAERGERRWWRTSIPGSSTRPPAHPTATEGCPTADPRLRLTERRLDRLLRNHDFGRLDELTV